MGELDDVRTNLRQLIELERASGVEWLPAAVPPTKTGDGRRETGGAPASAPPDSAIPAIPALGPPIDRQDSRLPSPVSRLGETVSRLGETVSRIDEATDPWTAPAELIDQPPAVALATIASAIAECRRCGLCTTRRQTVPGEGNATPAIVFVGEGPGAEEDASGRPFVGAAGQLLDKMIRAMGCTRDEVFIVNAIKCRPPGNRTPEPTEIASCHPFLMAQLAVLRPQVICTLGNVPLRALFGPDTPGITKVRGQRREWQGIPVIPTFHPSYLLRNESGKKPAWEDLKAVLAVLGRTPPGRGA